MAGFVTGAVIVLAGMTVLAILGIICEVTRVRKARSFAERDARRALRQAKQDVNVIREYKSLVRVATIRALTMGSKCRGCGETVPRDELKPTGEDAKGRPIDLCAPCRKLMGVESEDEQESKEASKEDDDQGIDIVE